jgi:dTMP kinase
VDGSGKSTQARLLARWMRSKGIDVVLTKEPGGTPLGRTLRRILLTAAHLDSVTELLLYAADRREHVRQVIEPALRAGRAVISERFAASSVAYQGYGRGLDLRLVEMLNKAAAGRVRPDLTVILDMRPEEARARMSEKRFDRLEALGIGFHRRVAKGYRAIGGKERGAVLVRASGTRGEVFARVRQIVECQLAGRGGGQ